ncbi:MAG: hypothetical protein HYX53_00320 [Chloroflexi bacterium]|nr:hypothetical protein [Chloroflexota bacterium]
MIRPSRAGVSLCVTRRPRRIIALLLDSKGVIAIPIAFAASAAVETLALGIVLALRLRVRTAAGPPAATPAAGV